MLDITDIERNDMKAAKQWLTEQLEAKTLELDMLQALTSLFDDWKEIEEVIDEMVPEDYEPDFDAIIALGEEAEIDARAAWGRDADDGEEDEDDEDS